MSQPEVEDGPPGNLEWSVCGASVTGSQHLSKGFGCDDAFSYGITGHFVVAAVADGAGSVTGTSAWGSHIASQSVVRAAMNPRFIDGFYTAEPDEADDIMRWLFNRALERVVAQAEVMGLTVPQLSTTLCVALARPDLAIFAQIGDGIIAVEEQGGIGTLLTEDKSEYANATWFIQSNDAFDASFRVAVRRDVSAFALSTDGMSYKITNIVSGEAYEPFFRTAWSSVKSNAAASDFAAMLRGIQDDQTGDDKTMVLATLDWREDKFFPSARPVQRTIVSSPAPQGSPTAQFSPPRTEPLPTSGGRDGAEPGEPSAVNNVLVELPVEARPLAGALASAPEPRARSRARRAAGEPRRRRRAASAPEVPQEQASTGAKWRIRRRKSEK